MNPIDLTCTDIVRIVATHEMISPEIIAALVQRTRGTMHYNTYSSYDGDLVLRAADHAIAKGKKPDLHGVPVALRDSINAVG